MGISNLSTGLRPGVCTSTTRPSTPFEGQMIYETDTNRVLVYEGAAWVMIADTDTPPGMELVKVQTIGTTVASVTVSSVFSSTYENYKITINGGVGSQQNNLQFVLDGITGSVYYQLGYYQSSWSSSSRADYASGASTYIIAADISVDGYSTDIELRNPNISKRKFGVLSGQSANNQYSMPFQIASTSTATGFTLTTSVGTLTGGTIRVYGYRNTI